MFENVFKGVPAPTSKEAISTLITNLTKYAVEFIGIVCIIFLIIGGIQYITSGGNQEGMQKAKATLTWAIIGLILVLSAYAVVNFFTDFVKS
jgi:cytochrome bd-type quinol oxidase subunit 2